MYIELKRIVSKKKKDESGKVIMDPTDRAKPLYYNMVSVESFPLSQLGRMRPWNRSKNSIEYPEIDGDITVIMIHEESGRKEEIRVNESHSKLLDRLQGLKLEHEYGKVEHTSGS